MVVMMGIFTLVVLIFSVMIHEVAHGYSALSLGDPTAKLAGRLTFNPLKHIDPFGSILFPLLLSFAGLPVLGWAKPVPYNPNNLTKDPRTGPLKVALAGPLSNILLALVFGLVARFGIIWFSSPAVGIFGFVAYLNLFLAMFNLVPIPPLDGSKILPLILPRRYAFAFDRVGFGGILIVMLFIYVFSGVLFAIVNRLFLAIAGGEVVNLMDRVLEGF